MVAMETLRAATTKAPTQSPAISPPCGKSQPELPETATATPVGIAPTGRHAPPNGYTIIATVKASATTFEVVRAATGALTYTCAVKTTNRGGCPGTGTKEGVWGP